MNFAVVLRRLLLSSKNSDHLLQFTPTQVLHTILIYLYNITSATELYLEAATRGVL